MDLTQQTLLARDLSQLGLRLSPKCQAVLDLHSAALAAASANPAQPLAVGLADGTLTSANVGERLRAAALEATAQEKAHELLRDLNLPARRAFAAALEVDAPRLLRDLSKVFAAPAKVMQKAGELFPVTATAEQVLTAGTEASDAWRGLAEARNTLDTIRSIRLTLARDYKIGDASSQPLLFTVGITSSLSLARAQDAWNHPSAAGGVWHSLAAAGFTLALADLEQIAAARAAITSTDDDDRDQERQAKADAIREDAKTWMLPDFPTADTAA